MIEEPPLLRVLSVASRQRPTQAQIKGFEGAQTGHVCDAMGGIAALDPSIKPLPGVPDGLCGPALTADCGPADILALTGALSEIQPGDVIVQATGGWMGCASIGDMVSGMAQNAGASGVVTDGCVRDLPGIQALDFPVFAAGISPNSPFSKGPGAIGHPVLCGGRQVASGDMVIGDQDGVVIVPFSQIDAVLTALKDVRDAEAVMEKKVRAGMAVPEKIEELMSGPQVVRS